MFGLASAEAEGANLSMSLGDQGLDLMVPEDAGSWLLRTQSQLNVAQALNREIEVTVAQNANVDLDQIGTRHARVVRGLLKEKITNTTQLMKSLQDETKKCDGAVRMLRECDLQLSRAAALKQAPLCICKRRLDLRSRRAPQELVRDSFQQAVEAEELALVVARESLGELLQSTRELLPSLEEVKKELQEDLLEKRRSGRIDHLCLLDASQRPGHLSTEDYLAAPTLNEVMTAEVPYSPGDAAPGTARINEDQRLELTKVIIQKAVRLAGEAQMRCSMNKSQIDIFAQDCAKASRRTEVCMKKSVAALTVQKKVLEEHLVDVDKMIFTGQLSLSRTERKLRRNENPLQSVDRQFSLRQRRVERENIRDPVHDQLLEHLEAVKRNVYDLSSRVDGTQSLVEELKMTKLRLQDFLQLKTMSLRLELACTRVSQKNVAGYFFCPCPRVGQPEVASGPLQENGTNLDGLVVPENGTTSDFANPPPRLLSSRGNSGSAKRLVSPPGDKTNLVSS